MTLRLPAPLQPGFPVLVDVDIGHRPPQLTLLNGLPAVVRFGEGGGSVSQAIPGKR